MFTAEGNAAVRTAVADYIAAATQKAAELGIIRFHDRMAHLQNRVVRSQQGYDYEEFFGHSPPELYDDAGNVIRTS
jgi:serine/threonine protein kinase HipA of HipAB toxin-antitoxin module